MRSQPECPLCGRTSDPAAAPFCGRGCRDRDLLNWLGDAYRLPVKPAEDAEADEALDSGRQASL